MTDKTRDLQRRTGGLKGEENADWRDQRRHFQYSQPADISQPIDLIAYKQVVRRAFGDAYALLKDYPARLRFSYYVDRHGRLRCQAERRTV